MGEVYVFRLYVAGAAANSVRARANLAAILAEWPAGSFTLEEVDVLVEPQRALADRILVTPTLLRVRPAPSLRVVGNLSEREIVVSALQLPARP
jgi:circadian clock protein KaiB